MRHVLVESGAGVLQKEWMPEYKLIRMENRIVMASEVSPLR
jgi:hypothetical protein